MRLLLLLAALSGCGEDPVTELIVVIDSDIPVPRMLDSLEMEVTGPSMITCRPLIAVKT